MCLNPEDVFSDSLQFLYDYAPITVSSDGAIFTYTPPQTPDAMSPSSRPAIILTTPKTQANNWSLHASSIWVSSVFLADHIDDLRIPDLLAFTRVERGEGRPLRVLELGAGAGLPSIYLARIYGQDVHVVASDYPDPESLRTLQDNVSENKASENCVVLPYAWGTDASSLIGSCPTHSPHAMDAQCYTSMADLGKFDLIIAADTLWSSDFHRPFLQTLDAVLSHASHARIQLVAGLHTGRYTIQSFMDLLSSYGLEVETVEECKVDGLERREWMQDRESPEDARDRRGWVLWLSMKRL